MQIFRRHRRRFHQYFQPRDLAAYYPIQKKVAVNLLEQLLQTPEKYSDHVKQCVHFFSENRMKANLFLQICQLCRP